MSESRFKMAEQKDKLLNLPEAAQLLGISEEDLQKLAEAGEITAYKIGGVFLRFKAEQLIQIKPEVDKKLKELLRNPLVSGRSRGQKIAAKPKQEKYTFLEKLIEFWHFYDFYIISLLIIIFILLAIFKLGI
jgi:excisionase family DNA binding protein